MKSALGLVRRGGRQAAEGGSPRGVRLLIIVVCTMHSSNRYV